MAIVFEGIPVGIRNPGQYVEYNNEKATSNVEGMPSRALILGQMFATGSAAPLTPILLRSRDHAAQLFGLGSQLWAMCSAWKAANKYTEVWAMGVADDAAGTAATGAIGIASAPSTTGTLTVTISGVRLRIAVTATDTASDVAAKLASVVNADGELPVTAAVNGVDATQVDLTCRWKGVTGTDIDLRGTYFSDAVQVDGVGLTITAMSGGAANPEVGDAIAAMGTKWWSDVVMPWQDAANVAAMDAEMERRRGPMVQMDCHCWSAKNGTYGELVTLGSGRNTKGITTMATTGSPVPPWIWAAALGAVAAFHLKQGPARPLQTLEMSGILPPAAADGLEPEETNVLLHNGIATYGVTENNTVTIARAITGYRVNKFGLADESYLDVQTLRLLSNLRYSMRARIAQRFPRHSLRDDGTRPPVEGSATVTPQIIRGELGGLGSEWRDREWIENLEAYKEGLIVRRNADDVSRVDSIIPPDVTNQFRIFAGRADYIL